MTTLHTRFGRKLTCRASQLIYIGEGEGKPICANDVLIGMPLTPVDCQVCPGGKKLESVTGETFFDDHDLYNYGMIVGLAIETTPSHPEYTYDVEMSGLRSMLPPCHIKSGDSAYGIICRREFILNQSVPWRLELLAGILDVTMNLDKFNTGCIQMNQLDILYFIQKLLWSLGCPSYISENKPVNKLSFRMSDFIKLTQLGLPVKYFKIERIENPADEPPIIDTIIAVEHHANVYGKLLTLVTPQKTVINGFLVQI